MSDYKVNDIVEMKKPHPCGPQSKHWKLLEIGADVRMQCCNCGYVVLMKRWDFEKKLVKIIKGEN